MQKLSPTLTYIAYGMSFACFIILLISAISIEESADGIIMMIIGILALLFETIGLIGGFRFKRHKLFSAIFNLLASPCPLFVSFLSVLGAEKSLWYFSVFIGVIATLLFFISSVLSFICFRTNRRKAPIKNNPPTIPGI